MPARIRPCGLRPRGAQPGEQIGQFLRGEQWIRDLRPVERARHVAGVVPHLLGEGDGVPERIPFGDRPNARADGRIDPMTLPAAPGKKYLSSAPGVAGRLEIAGRVEKDEQVGGLLLIHRGHGHAFARRRAPHRRSMVPHEGRHVVGAEAPIPALPKIRRLLPAHAIHAVADNTVEALEQRRATFRIAQQKAPRRARIAGDGGDDEEPTGGLHTQRPERPRAFGPPHR